MMCSRRVLQILSEQANVLSKIANFHCFGIVLKSLFDVANYLHKVKHQHAKAIWREGMHKATESAAAEKFKAG